MARQETLKNVPNAEVQQVVTAFKSAGATNVAVTPNPDGNTSTVVATFPD